MNREVFAAMGQLSSTDYRTAVRQITGLTGGERRSGGYEDELVRQFLERVPQEVVTHLYSSRSEVGTEIGESLRSLNCPLLLVQHRECLMFTHEGYEDAVSAFPEARTLTLPDKPSTSPEFADALRSFCEDIGA
jgi:hypothetical protein